MPASTSPDKDELVKRWRTFVDSAQDALVCIDGRGGILLFNRAAETMFGYREADVVGRNVTLLMPEPWASQHDGYLASYREEGLSKAIGRIRHVEARRESNEVFPVELSVSETCIGDVTIYLGIIRDVSGRTRVAERIRQRERLADVGALVSRIVHDVANPLAGLSMLAERIRRRIDRTPEAPVSAVADAAWQIGDTVRQLERLVHDFKAFVREQRLEIVDIDLAAFLQEVATFWRVEAAARNVRLQVTVPAKAHSLRGDRDKLRRVLDNLVKNALEAINGGSGTVGVEVEDYDEMLRLTVNDTGDGLEVDVDPFALFETTKSEGTGLGLPVCRQIVEAHGGRIHLESRGAGGTSAVVELPFGGPPHPSMSMNTSL